MPLSKEVRRVVTTVNAEGKAVVLFDSDNPNKKVREGRGTVSRLLWVTNETPADIAGPKDRGSHYEGVAPPRNGSVFRMVDIPPITKRHMPPRHPLMHATRTIDYAIIMAGEIDMLLDDEEIHLKAGDVLIQQGTNHAWVNRGTEPCRIAFVLIDAQEP
jgi:mannose-6-phosphate isomerase-like protein (cupin superfamily)